MIRWDREIGDRRGGYERRSDDRLTVSSGKGGSPSKGNPALRERRSDHISVNVHVDQDSKRGFRGEGHLCPGEGLSRTLGLIPRGDDTALAWQEVGRSVTNEVT